MFDRRQVLVGAAGAAGMLAAEAVAQTSPAPAATPPESPYAVTYIEVEPAQADASRRLLARYQEALKDKGALEFAVFEQMGRPNHFAIVEQWPSAKAREDNAASAARPGVSRGPRAAPDRTLRRTSALCAVDWSQRRPRRADHAADAHRRITSSPTSTWCRRSGRTVSPQVRKLAEASRGTAGNVRFDALVQASRLNHLTLVEAWTDSPAQEAHSAANPTKSFRSALGPMSGALYDERLYTLLK